MPLLHERKGIFIENQLFYTHEVKKAYQMA